MPLKYNSKVYKQDFPEDIGDWNWKVALVYPHDKFKKHKIGGVLLHDGRFVTHGILFDKHEFKILGKFPPTVTIFHRIYWATLKKPFSKIHFYCWFVPKLWIKTFIIHPLLFPQDEK